jgi:hypothetical protein
MPLFKRHSFVQKTPKKKSYKHFRLSQTVGYELETRVPPHSRPPLFVYFMFRTSFVFSCHPAAEA